MTAGLNKFQQHAQIPATGVYDAATAAQREEPRCANSDHIGLGWAVVGQTWDHANITYRWDNYWASLPRADQRQAIQAAFNTWSEVCPEFFQIKDVGSPAEIVIEFAVGDHGDGVPFDGPGHVYAHTFYPPPNGPFAGEFISTEPKIGMQDL